MRRTFLIVVAMTLLLPSLAAAMAQIFSVHDGSLVATTAKVSVI